MKQTLLEITQDILQEMSSFPVNGIADTVESEQVAGIVKAAYFDIMALREWAHSKKTITLDSATSTRPTHLSTPAHVKRVMRIMYDVRKTAPERLKYQELVYLTPEQFLSSSLALNSTATNVDTVVDPGGATILVRNDKQPQYWTSFDDQYIVCDSYYSTLDTHLQSSKTQALVVMTPTWTHADTFYPDLPEEAYPYLVAEATSRAFLSLKGVANEKAEQSAARHRMYMSQAGWKLNSGGRIPNFGRTPPGSTKNPYLEK
jgi:hypothetical protein